MVAYSPDMSTEQRQELLETIDVEQRLKLVSAFLARQIEILELKGKIQSEVKSEMDKTQREYILREQLKAIQRELGEDDPQGVRFLALRAGGRPVAERGRCGPYELGQDLLGEKVEVLGLAEEFRVVGRDEVDEVVDLVSAGR